MFIKMRDGSYIPMIESGDSNVWECDNRRRARDWSSCRWLHESEEQRSRYSLTEDEILGSARREIDNNLERYVGTEPAFGGPLYTKEQVLADLGFFNAIKINGHSTTSASQFFNFFKSGIRNAVTMDEMRCGLRLSWYELTDDKKSSKWCTDSAADEDELAEKWEMYRSKGITPWIGLGESSGEYAWQLMKIRTAKHRTERKRPDGAFIIAFTYGGVDKFVVEVTGRNMKFNSWRQYAHKYSSKKVAENAASKIARRFSQITNVRVVNA